MKSTHSHLITNVIIQLWLVFTAFAQTGTYTSDFHKTNSKKVVFSNSRIQSKKENPTEIKASFKAGEYIYAMAYFEKELNKITTSEDMKAMINVDGRFFDEVRLGYAKEDGTITYYSMEIIPNPSDRKYREGISFTKALTRLAPGKHTIEISIPGSTGSFEFDNSAGNDALNEINTKLQEAKADVKLPTPAMVNPALEKEMIDAFKAAPDVTSTPLKVIIRDKEWRIDKNASGIIVSRTMMAYMVTKHKDDKCKVVSISFIQKYNGGNYGKTTYSGIGSSYDIKCENVK